MLLEPWLRFLLVALLAAMAAAQDQVGPLPVGFTRHWSLDFARSYDTTFADGSTYAGGHRAPRPVLVEVWYPAAPAADATPMRRGDYLDVATSDARLAPFARALEAYAKGVVADEVLDKKADERGPDDEAALAAVLAAPAHAVRDAPPLGVRNPLVLYHAGYGSSYEDNVAFCERLASHGYVVASSAWQQADGASFNIDSRDGSIADLAFLVDELARRPDVDAAHLGLVGHSGGAHMAYRAQARPQAPWDALVLLDTTQDYWSVREPRWTHVADALAAIPNFRVPMLVCADRNAIFDLADRLTSADRWYLTFRQLGHNSFIEHGVMGLELAARRAAAAPATDGQPSTADDDARIERAGFDHLCRTARLFLDAQLKGDPSAAAALAAEAAASAPGDVESRLEHVPPGVAGPPAWDPAGDAPPEPRQLRGALATLGAAELVKRMDAWHAAQPNLPIFSRLFGLSLSWELVDGGRLDEARVVAPFYGRINPEGAGVDLWFVKLSSKPGREAWKTSMLQSALLMSPDNAEVKAAWEAWQAEQAKAAAAH